MSDWISHLPVLPILLPLLAGAAMLLLGEARRATRVAIALGSTLLQAGVALALLHLADGGWPALWPDGIAVYALGGWPAPFGIVLVVDRLAAVMLALTALLALAALVYALARWDRMGPHFHPLFQFLLMGINGAFLTGDLFNLFVFFEVLLAASYGLMLHGSGTLRVKAGLHYIVINLVASSVFLIGVALIYGAAGTLNMAHLALRAQQLAGGDRVLLEAGCAILGVAFLLKAGVWPLNFWLAGAYGTAAAPVAAIFSIMTKVGIYALLRLATLLGVDGAPVPAPFNDAWLFGIGIATLLFGSAALLTVQQPQRLVAYCVIVSSGTLLAGLGSGGAAMAGPTLYYLASSVLATGAFFMLCEMIERSQAFGASMLAITMESFGLDDPIYSDRPDEVVGVTIPAAMAFLGLGFVSCALLVTGLPPLSGFIAKFWMLSAALGAAPAGTPSAWMLLAAVLGSGLAGMVALSRMGSRLFWGAQQRSTPRLHLIEAAPVALLILLSAALVLAAEPAARYLQATGAALHAPHAYIRAVLPATLAAPLMAPAIARETP